MMDKQELEKFKQIVESDIVAKKINEVEKENRPMVIASLLNYLSLVKDYENIEFYIHDFLIDNHKEVHLLPIDFLEEKKRLSPNEIDNFLYTTLINIPGYRDLYKTRFKSVLFK